MNLRPDDIVCFEVGSGDVPAWIGSRRALEDDWPAIERQAARGVIQLDVTDDAVTIRGATRVGLVVLPSGRRLVVRSKIPSLKLLEWLAYLGEFPRLTAWLSDAGVGVGDDWHQCLARLFLRALEHVTQRHVRKDYVSIAADRPEIRGRILTAALGRRLHRLPRVPQIQRQRTLDTPFNIVLALALDRLPAMLPDASDADRRRMARLREQWGSISRRIEDPASAVTAAQWACPAGYRHALQLARLILAGASLDSDSHMGGQSFTLPLATVWEHAVRRMCDDLADSTGWRRLSGDQRVRHWDDPAGHRDRTRWLIADVIVQRANSRWVLDAKYKREFADESRVDRFQMCAYAVAFDADRVTLVYPTAKADAATHELLHTTVGGKHLLIDSLALPMSAGPEACRAALASVATRVPDVWRPRAAPGSP
jgi:5-methylcytosine-specific restriction endonuclease McrBC regulatory subunit McrC